MSTISKSLSGFIFNGSALVLASAAFKSNLNTVYGFNSAGTAYTSFKPGNIFNSLTQLVQDGVYIVDAKTPGFELPGAMLTATSPVVNPLSLPSFAVAKDDGGATISCTLNSTDSQDTNVQLTIAQGDDILSSMGMSSPGADSESYFALAPNTAYRAIFVTNMGHVLTRDFTTPA